MRAQEKCRCHRANCYKVLDVLKNSLLQFLKIFWSLSKHVQDEYLRTVTGGLDKQAQRRSWLLMGKCIGPKCCLAVLGVGNCRMVRVEQGKFDRRFAVWGKASC